MMLMVRERRAADHDREPGRSPFPCPGVISHFALHLEKHMNILTNLVAGLAHFLGWLI